jgi:impB/mucB/samB family
MMLEIMREYSPRVEHYSIDEFFFEATPGPGKDERQYGEMLRDRIWERVRVPVTVGIRRTKTLAKLVSDTARPFGAKALLDRQAEEELLARNPVTEVAGLPLKHGRPGRFAAPPRQSWRFGGVFSLQLCHLSLPPPLGDRSRRRKSLSSKCPCRTRTYNPLIKSQCLSILGTARKGLGC